MNGRNKAMCYTKDIHSYRKFSRNQSKEGISMSSIETFLQMVKEKAVAKQIQFHVFI